MSLIRSFLAVLLDPEIKRDIYRAVRRLQKLPHDMKWVAEKNYHLTMKFFGDLSGEEIDQAIAILEPFAAGRSPFYLQCGELTAFPNRRRPRILCLPLHGETDTLQDLWQKSEAGLARAGFPEEKRKSFHPHITLGRFHHEKNIVWKELIDQAGPFPEQRFLVRDLYLMSSKLTPQGPRYKALAKFPFQATG